MSHLNLELHENYPHERIADSEHDVVREEMAEVGLHNIALTNGVEQHLPRATYFGSGVDAVAISGALSRIELRLKRKLSAEYTIGDSRGYGLRPVMKLASLLAMVPTIPMLEMPGVPGPKKSSLSEAMHRSPTLYGTLLTGKTPVSTETDWASLIVGPLKKQ